MRCFYHEDYYLALPAGHPFPMEKFPQAHDQIKDLVRVEAPQALARVDVERVHSPIYLAAVNGDLEAGDRPGLSRYERHRLGLPSNPRLLDRSMLETAGTVSAILTALEEGVAANLAGGTHHAFPDHGLGFCVLNDVAIAIETLRARGKRFDQTLIVDTDAHQGNANHAWFAEDDTVFTYSIHVGRNYPSKKEPGDLDVPLDRFVAGLDYLKALEATLPAAFARTEPDLVVWISGADNHLDDRFGQMRLTTEQMELRDRFILRLCRDYGAATAVVYGGGYNRTPGKTATLHAQTISLTAEMLGNHGQPG